jgi:hypothetical protein
MWHALERREKCTRFWWENQRNRWEVGVRIYLRAIAWEVRSGFNWLMIVTGCGLLL